MTAQPADVPVFDQAGLAKIYLEFPAESGPVTYTWRVDAETLDAVFALLDERGADS
jgi:hypothetical protein